MSRKNIQPQHTNALPVYVRYLDLVNLCNISNQKNPKDPGFFRLFSWANRLNILMFL